MYIRDGDNESDRWSLSGVLQKKNKNLLDISTANDGQQHHAAVSGDHGG